MYCLADAESRFFNDAGYLRLRTPLPEGCVERMTAVIRDHFKREVPPFRVNKDGRVRRLDQLIGRDPIFLESLRLPQALLPLQSLLGPNIEIPLYRHNHATMNYKGDVPFRLHRDILQWSRALVTAFIYLEQSTVENGCTHVVPGTQSLPFAGMPPDGGGGNWADDHEEYKFVTGQVLPVPMEKGGVLLIDSLLFHSVGENSTEESRMSMTFAFHSVDDLSGLKDDPRRVLLCGERIYMGSDSKHVSGLLSNPDGY
jgi:ectoine hydroxylase-related dioxygenase (phytanoyl-CoA dioxygenase family)